MDVPGFGVGLSAMWVSVCSVSEDLVPSGVGEVGHIEIWVGLFGTPDLVRL